MAKVVVIKFNLDDPKDKMAYELLKSGGKKTVEKILNYYAKEKEEPIPEKIIVDGLDYDELKTFLETILDKRFNKFEKKLKNIKFVSKEGELEEEEEEENDFKPSQPLANLINSINAGR